MRVAIVCEGRTDFLILEQVVLGVLGPCQVDPIQPLRDELDPTKWGVAGWTVVREWCMGRQSQGIADEMAIGSIDVLVLHVDGDLCGQQGLPATRKELCDHIKVDWIGPPTVPRGVVICIPAVATDSWVAAALDPSLRNAAFESDTNPLGHLARMGLQKNQYDYRVAGPDVREATGALRALPEVDRFVGKLTALRT